MQPRVIFEHQLSMEKLMLIVVLGFGTLACGKNSTCFDADLKKEYEAAFCTEDCPGIKGCDGKNYCNECIAAREGIRPK